MLSTDEINKVRAAYVKKHGELTLSDAMVSEIVEGLPDDASRNVVLGAIKRVADKVGEAVDETSEEAAQEQSVEQRLLAGVSASGVSVRARELVEAIDQSARIAEMLDVSYDNDIKRKVAPFDLHDVLVAEIGEKMLDASPFPGSFGPGVNRSTGYLVTGNERPAIIKVKKGKRDGVENYYEEVAFGMARGKEIVAKYQELLKKNKVTKPKELGENDQAVYNTLKGRLTSYIRQLEASIKLYHVLKALESYPGIDVDKRTVTRTVGGKEITTWQQVAQPVWIIEKGKRTSKGFNHTSLVRLNTKLARKYYDESRAKEGSEHLSHFAALMKTLDRGTKTEAANVNADNVQSIFMGLHKFLSNTEGRDAVTRALVDPDADKAMAFAVVLSRLAKNIAPSLTSAIAKVEAADKEAEEQEQAELAKRKAS